MAPTNTRSTTIVIILVVIIMNTVNAAAGKVATTTSSTANNFFNGMLSTFEQCYVGCFVLCAIVPTQTLSSCGFECLKDCLVPPAAEAANNYNLISSKNVVVPNLAFRFCNLGCAYAHRCSNISTLDNPRGKEVAGCVGSCSGPCRKYNYIKVDQQQLP